MLYIGKQLLHHLIDIGIGLAEAQIGFHSLYFLDCLDGFSVRHIAADRPAASTQTSAAGANRLQTSMNLAFGSALASIGLTIPVVVIAAVWLGLPLTLGVAPKDMALLTLTFIVGAITLGSGRTNLMQGAIHLVVFAAFLFLTFVP